MFRGGPCLRDRDTDIYEATRFLPIGFDNPLHKFEIVRVHRTSLEMDAKVINIPILYDYDFDDETSAFFREVIHECELAV